MYKAVIKTGNEEPDMLILCITEIPCVPRKGESIKFYVTEDRTGNIIACYEEIWDVVYCFDENNNFSHIEIDIQ